MDALCYVRANDFAKHFADVEPLTICHDCGQEIATAYERCAACQAKHDEFIENTNNPDDPRR